MSALNKLNVGLLFTDFEFFISELVGWMSGEVGWKFILWLFYHPLKISFFNLKNHFFN